MADENLIEILKLLPENERSQFAEKYAEKAMAIALEKERLRLEAKVEIARIQYLGIIPLIIVSHN